MSAGMRLPSGGASNELVQFFGLRDLGDVDEPVPRAQRDRSGGRDDAAVAGAAAAENY